MKWLLNEFMFNHEMSEMNSIAYIKTDRQIVSI